MPKPPSARVITDRVKGKDINGQVITLERTQPRQLSLFQTFLSDEERYSNTIELYEAVPKYFSNHKIMASMREGGKYLPVLKRAFEHKGDTYILYIRPARLLYPNGAEMEHYPSPREELVEEALRKIASDRDKGVYLDDVAGVQFTLYGLKKDNRSATQNLTLATAPVDSILCGHGHTSHLTTGTLGPDPTRSPGLH